MVPAGQVEVVGEGVGEVAVEERRHLHVEVGAQVVVPIQVPVVELELSDGDAGVERDCVLGPALGNRRRARRQAGRGWEQLSDRCVEGAL